MIRDASDTLITVTLATCASRQWLQLLLDGFYLSLSMEKQLDRVQALSFRWCNGGRWLNERTNECRRQAKQNINIVFQSMDAICA